jgi:hypothetical protein
MAEENSAVNHERYRDLLFSLDREKQVSSTTNRCSHVLRGGQRDDSVRQFFGRLNLLESVRESLQRSLHAI